MAHDVIATCPVCEQELSVTRLHCRSCGTTLDGDFRVGRFGRLNREQLDLLEGFLRSRGNLREMERETGLSYPTLRGRVDALIRALGLGEPPVEVASDEVAAADVPAGGEPLSTAPVPSSDAARRTVLERLARHEVTAAEASRSLRELPRSREG
ncbi:MAG TPA: DUF2089 domain-containing protein [Candidatus Sulfotelmatobacter sp.]|nr:DUF2089 domain-containing protein [Candidatus Sulfotelmatobacter sp.]